MTPPNSRSGGDADSGTSLTNTATHPRAASTAAYGGCVSGEGYEDVSGQRVDRDRMGVRGGGDRQQNGLQDEVAYTADHIEHPVAGTVFAGDEEISRDRIVPNLIHSRPPHQAYGYSCERSLPAPGLY